MLKAIRQKVSFWGYNHLSGRELNGSGGNQAVQSSGWSLPSQEYPHGLAFSTKGIYLHSKRSSPEFKFLFCDRSNFYLSSPASFHWSTTHFSTTYSNIFLSHMHRALFFPFLGERLYAFWLPFDSSRSCQRHIKPMHRDESSFHAPVSSQSHCQSF